MSSNHTIQTKISHQDDLTDTGKHAGVVLRSKDIQLDILTNCQPEIKD